MSITHTFASSKTDSADASLVRPSNWNAAHAVDTLVIPTTVTAQAIGNATPNFQVLGAGGDASIIGIAAYSTTASTVPEVRLAKSANATVGSHTIVVTGEDLGVIRFLGSNGTTFDTAALILAEVDGTPGAADMPGRLSFWTTPDASVTPLQRMRIQQNGRIAFGTGGDTDPGLGFGVQYTFATNSSTVVNMFICQTSADTSSAEINFTKSRSTSFGGWAVVNANDELGVISFWGADGTNGNRAARIRAFSDGTPGNDDMPGRLVFETTADAGADTTERMRINNSGKVLVSSAGTYVTPLTDTPPLQILGTTADTSSIVIGRWSADTTGPKFYFAKSRNATIGSFTVVNADDGLGQITWATDDGVDINQGSAQIAAFADAASGSGDVPGRLVFYTTPDASTTLTERLRITNQGQVWIANTTAVPAAGGTVATTAMALQFSSGTNFGIYVGSGAPTVASATGSIYLRTDGTTTTERLYVRTNGGAWATFTASA